MVLSIIESLLLTYTRQAKTKGLLRLGFFREIRWLQLTWLCFRAPFFPRWRHGGVLRSRDPVMASKIAQISSLVSPSMNIGYKLDIAHSIQCQKLYKWLKFHVLVEFPFKVVLRPCNHVISSILANLSAILPREFFCVLSLPLHTINICTL